MQPCQPPKLPSKPQHEPEEAERIAKRKRDACWHSLQANPAQAPSMAPYTSPRSPWLRFVYRVGRPSPQDVPHQPQHRHPFQWSTQPHLHCYVAKAKMFVYPSAPLAKQFAALTVPALLTLAYDQADAQPTSYAITYFGPTPLSSGEWVLFSDARHTSEQKQLYVALSKPSHAQQTKGSPAKCWPGRKTTSPATSFALRRKSIGRWQPESMTPWLPVASPSLPQSTHPPHGHYEDLTLSLFAQQHPKEPRALFADIVLESPLLPIHARTTSSSLVRLTNAHQIDINKS